ncbi:MAG: hypothetical protein KDC34_08005 [Saprospiraceae bacterium]|nr:hypothetical protein [Saprospiraceae bacterium]
MENRRTKKYDLLACGELLIDFISSDFAEKLDDISDFKRLLGGSPANMSMNMSRLGNQVLLVATVGNDDMGQFLAQSVGKLGLDVQHIRRATMPTTLILVTRSREVSNFEAYRSADCEILESQLSPNLLNAISIFHTTCFALSRKPAQENILVAAEKAHKLGAQLSIDVNYASKIWPDQAQAQAIVKSYVSKGALVKVSEVDWERLYGTTLDKPELALDHFLGLGASLVCVTLGGDGCWVGDDSGHAFLPSRKVEVKDTTGAGDAFWSGFLTAWLDGYDKHTCALAGRSMAELKIAHFGPLPDQVDRMAIYPENG